MIDRQIYFLFIFFFLLKDSSKPVTRESWMTELPPEMKDFGLGPRTFKRRADDKSGDRSIWTDTPADRERKAKVRGFVCSCIRVMFVQFSKDTRQNYLRALLFEVMIPKEK
jgi:hypothetical protein